MRTGPRVFLARGLAIGALVTGSARMARAAVMVARSAGGDWVDWAFRTMADSAQIPGRVTRPFEQHPTVHRALRVLSRMVGSVPIEMFRKDTDVVDETHPLLRVLARPNALMRGTQLIESTALDVNYHGNALWWLGNPTRLADGSVVPSSVRRLDPLRTRLELDLNDEPRIYVISTSRGELSIPADQVVHFKDWNPHDEAWGFGWVEAAEDEYEADFLASKWDKRWFQRGASPGDILMPREGATISDEQAIRIKEAWLAAASNLLNPHSPIVMPKGLELAKPTQMGHRDMDFVMLRRFTRENILSAAGTPPAAAGILEYANYANMSPQMKMLVHLEVIPLMHYLETVINSDFLPRYDNQVQAYFKIENLLSLLDEMPAKVETGQKLWSMGVPLALINDRLELGLDLSGVEGSDQGYLPFSVAPVSAAGERESKPPATPVSTNEPDETDGEASPGAESLRVRMVKAASGPADQNLKSPEWRYAIWRALVRHVDDLESRMHARWRSHLGSLRDEVLERLSRGKTGVSYGAPVSRAGRVEAIVFDLDEANSESILSAEPIWRAAMLRGADTVSAQVGVGISFDFLDPHVLQLLSNRRQEIRGVNERVASDLRELLGEGLSASETEEQLRLRVLDFFAGERANARTLARTETFAAFSGGRFEAMREVGVSRHQWLTSRDAKVRDAHEAQDREERMVGEPFTNLLLYPLDPAGPAGEVINCRCVTIPAGVA